MTLGLQGRHTSVTGRDNGLFVIYHTDGNFLPLAPDLIAAGVHALQPFEAKAGLEAEDIKARFGGRVVIMGNMSAPELSAGPDRMRHELETKLPVLMRDGGYLYSSDHSIPPGMSFADYATLVDIVRSQGCYATAHEQHGTGE